MAAPTIAPLSPTIDEPAAGSLPSTRERIVAAAADLLAAGGREAVTTRAVSTAAGVQSPTIYRQFGDMRGLLDAVAAHGFAAYLDSKMARPRADDPVEDLRHAMDHHIAFGLENPAVYTLVYGSPRPDRPSEPRAIANGILDGLVQRAAEAGRLRVGTARAARMIQSVGTGVVLTLLATPPAERDLAAARAACEAILAAVTRDGPVTGGEDEAVSPAAVHHAVALRAALPALGASLSPGE